MVMVMVVCAPLVKRLDFSSDVRLATSACERASKLSFKSHLLSVLRII